MKLDVCCGTGAIGLSMAAAVHKLVGIEICAPAVEDARRNAARNGVANARFVAGKAEDRMDGVLSSLTPEEKAALSNLETWLGETRQQLGRGVALAEPSEAEMPAFKEPDDTSNARGGDDEW